jgi:heme exporter protein A
MSSIAIDVQDVSKRFGPRWALARVSFQLRRGGSLLLTGHNGSGKTTLLRLLATAVEPTAGSAQVLGLDSRKEKDSIRARVGLLSHASFLYEDLSAEQNLMMVARLLGRTEAKEECAALLGQVGLASRSSHPVRQFSAGMRKRLAIARLLLKSPELALLDEPFGELDPSGIRQMEELIAALTSRGTTVVLATHLVDQGMSLCTERLHLHEGRLAQA